MCSLFGISRQAYYKQKLRNLHVKAHRNQIVELVLPYRKKMSRLGTIKVYDLIKPQMEQNNVKCGRDKLFRILKEERMLIKKKKNYTKTTNSMHRYKRHPNLIVNLNINRPEQVWVSDITYIKTKKRHLYLSLVTDAFSKKIMGYYLANNQRAESSLKALNMAINNRIYPDKALIHHSDRGFQYCADEYTEVLVENNIDISMTTKYDPYENAIAERVNGILKSEFDIGEGFIDMKDAKKVIKESIQTYNQLRPHLTCRLRTPNQAHINPNFEPVKWKKKNYKQKILINRTT